MRRSLNPASLPATPFYSHGVEIDASARLVFVSGQVGQTSDGQTLDGIEAQAQQAVTNLNAVLAEAGLTAEDIVKMTIYLTDAANIGPFMAAAAVALPAEPPATTLLVVAGLASPDLLIEVEAVAAGS